MLSKNRKLALGALILSTAAILLLFSITIFAQDRGYRMEGGGMMGMRGDGMMGWNQNMPEKYWLTAEQLQKVREIRSEYNNEILPLQRKLSSLRIEARGYAENPDAEIAKIKNYREDIRGLEGKIDDLRLDARAAINKILTKEQRVYFSDAKHPSDNFDWWDMDGGMMGNMGDGMGMRNMCR